MSPESALHLNPDRPLRLRQSARPPAPVPRGLACLFGAALALSLSSGCGALPLEELEDEDDIAVRLDANARAHTPGRQIKFYVDLFNRTESDVDVRGIRIELKASPRASSGTVSLRQTWRYRWSVETPPPPIAPGKRMTIPVVPERGVEFPLEILRAGSYHIVAVVNDRFSSPPYPLEILRPDVVSG